HLAASFGRTMDTISADGWAIAEQIPMLEDSDTPEAVAASTGRWGARFAHAYTRQRLDLVGVLVDRGRMLSARVAARPGALTVDSGDPAAHVDELLAALEKVDDATLVVTYPNADTTGRVVIDRIEELAARSPRVRLARSLGDRLYLSLLAHADAMVGNSSSG